MNAMTSIKTALCLTAFALMVSCSKKDEAKPVTETKPAADVKTPAVVNQSATDAKTSSEPSRVIPASTVSVDAPVGPSNDKTADITKALIQQRGPVPTVDAQGNFLNGSVAPSVANNKSAVDPHEGVKLDAASKLQVTQTPATRLESRTQAMREMRWERAQATQSPQAK